jgi:hypothetical protein
MDTLQRRLILTLDSTPIQFVLTTPAIWSHEAQNTTCKAAKKAGFASRAGDTLSMVSEPEAAASYCLREIFSQNQDTASPLRVTSYRHLQSVSIVIMVSEHSGILRAGNESSFVMLAAVLS